MPLAYLGARRLYDCLGIEVADSGEFREEVVLEIGQILTVYLGPKPLHGITSLEASQYAIPGRKSVLLNSNNNYESDSFMEVTVASPREITAEDEALLQAGD